MDADLINFTGKIMSRCELRQKECMLLESDFIYQSIHLMDGRPLHVEAHSEIVIRALLSLYGSSFRLTTESLRKEIRALVEANKLDRTDELIRMIVVAPQKGNRKINWLLCPWQQMLYKGYVLWHKPLRAIVKRYEYPFAQFPTSVSMAAHSYVLGHVERQGADIAITQNHKKVITGAGYYPFFAVSGRRIFTTPTENYALDSVLRRLGILACEKAGFEVVEQPLYTEQLGEFEEFFIVTNQGVASIGVLDDIPYPTSAAKIVAGKMATLTDNSLTIDEMFLK